MTEHKDICVVCSRPIHRDLDTIRFYYADRMANPEYNKLPGYCCSSCFNKDFDNFKRPRSMTKPRPPSDPSQTELF